MAACIVCNQKTMPDDVLEITDMVSLCARLEKVLDEPVPVNAVMCSSCKFDLSQIELYYALLTVFKKRYSETAKLRLQNVEGETNKNVLQETADCSSERFKNILGAADISADSTDMSLSTDAVTKDGIHGNQADVSSMEIVNIRSVKVEPVDTPSFMETSSSNIGERLEENPKTIAFPIWRPEEGAKRRGRTRRSVQTTGHMQTVKRGRPRKGETSNVRGVKKRGRMKKSNVSFSVPKKRGRPKKSETSNNAQSVDPMGSGDFDNDDSEGEMAMEEQSANAEAGEHSSDPSSDDKTLDDEEWSVKQEKSKTTAAPRRKQRSPKKVEQDTEVHTCPVCNKEIIGSYKLTVHMRCHTDDRPHLCPQCGKGFKDKGGLRGHMQIHKVVDKPFVCTKCLKDFKRKKDLDRHMFVHSDERTVPCENCDEMFKSMEDLRRHIKYKHVQGRKYLCNICGMSMYTEGNLRRHIISHSEVKLFNCETCGRGFTSKQSLINHEYSHKPEGTREKFLCSTCGKEFMHKYYLNCHVKTHTGESKHYCATCDKYFMKGALYKSHMRIHTNERPFRCNDCGKAFKQRSNLRIHAMTHNDERPWKCACGQAFRQKAKLQRHMRTKVHAAFEKNTPSSDQAASVFDQTPSTQFAPPVVIAPPIQAQLPAVPPPPMGPLVMALAEIHAPTEYGYQN